MAAHNEKIRRFPEGEKAAREAAEAARAVAAASYGRDNVTLHDDDLHRRVTLVRPDLMEGVCIVHFEW